MMALDPIKKQAADYSSTVKKFEDTMKHEVTVFIERGVFPK